MRIAFFADNFYPELSGIVDSILITGRELVKCGHEVAFVGPHYLPKDYEMVGKQCTETNGREHLDGMPVVRLTSIPLPMSPTGQSRFAFPTGEAVEFLREWKPDIIHTQSPYGVGFEAKKAARKLGVPLVGTNHTPIEEFYPFAPGLMRKYDAWYYNHCVFVSTPFEKLITNMREVGFKAEARAIPNPVVHTLFNPPAEGEKAKIKQELGLVGPVILYTGRVAAEKHINLIIKAVAKLLPNFPTIKLVVTGHGAALKSLQLQAQELHVAENILFTGFIPTDTLALYYKATDIFTIMSTADSQSIALMQAYATGVPAVAARAQGLPDYVPLDCGFLVSPGDVEALTQKLKVFLEDEPLRVKMGQAGQSFIKKLSPDNIVSQWEEIYQNAIHQK